MRKMSGVTLKPTGVPNNGIVKNTQQERTRYHYQLTATGYEPIGGAVYEEVKKTPPKITYDRAALLGLRYKNQCHNWVEMGVGDPRAALCRCNPEGVTPPQRRYFKWSGKGKKGPEKVGTTSKK